MTKLGILGMVAAALFAGESGQASPKRVPFYIFIGQSNSGWLGTAGMSAEQKAEYGGVLPETDIWNPANGGYKAKWEPLQAGVNTRCENFADPTAFGPEASLFASLQKQKKTRRLLYKQGQGGTSLAVDWKPVVPYVGGAGSRFAQFSDWLPLAAAQAKDLGYALDLKAILWMQGETDAETEAAANAYLDNLRAFFGAVDRLWQRISDQHGFPKAACKRVIGRINAPGFKFRDAVRKAQETYCADAASRAVLIDTDKYPLDWVHYTAAGQIQFGLDIFAAAKLE
jgi:Carbohydrate esterase, sialic acid-specific acetylesterase